MFFCRKMTLFVVVFVTLWHLCQTKIYRSQYGTAIANNWVSGDEADRYKIYVSESH